MMPKNSDLNRRTTVKTDLLIKNVKQPTTNKTKFKVKTKEILFLYKFKLSAT